ncbi:hypothetical protein [Pseudonocardia sp. TMWB2A]
MQNIGAKYLPKAGGDNVNLNPAPYLAGGLFQTFRALLCINKDHQ